jgi:hypothetical protein
MVNQTLSSGEALEALASILGSFIGVVGAFGASWYALRRQLKNEHQRWAHARFVEGGVEPLLELLSSAKVQIDDYLGARMVRQAFDLDFGHVHSSFYRIRRRLESLSLWPEDFKTQDPIERASRDLSFSLREATRKWANVTMSDTQWAELQTELLMIRGYFSEVEILLEQIEKSLGAQEADSREALKESLSNIVNSASKLGVYGSKDSTLGHPLKQGGGARAVEPKRNSLGGSAHA